MMNVFISAEEDFLKISLFNTSSRLVFQSLFKLFAYTWVLNEVSASLLGFVDRKEEYLFSRRILQWYLQCQHSISKSRLFQQIFHANLTE